MSKLVFATGNAGKLKEVKNIFSGTSISIVSMNELGEIGDIPETGDTFEKNAFIKAKTVFDEFGLPTIADDSGLAIEQLDNRPGVFSARYAGENCTFDDNNRKVIKELEDFPEPHRAKFISFALYYDGKEKLSALGELPGIIINEFRGQNGFGYDPIFVPDGFEKTLAELSLEEKNSISHRARAFNKLKEILQKNGV